MSTHRHGVQEERPDGVRAPWSRSERPLPRRVVRPLQSFLDEESSSGIVLLGAAIVALVWANSPWRDSYEELWTTELTLRLGSWSIAEDLRHWVNDGLMSLFFLVVGLEIKRELLTGELRDPRTASVPVVAALGGMVVPALLYVAVNAAGGEARGWGVPMATDIAFAVGVLTIAARHAPSGVKPFLLTLAIVDDIGAILVIALFYSGEIAWPALGAALALCVAIAGLQRIQVRAAFVYVAIGVGVWLAVFESGVHPTIAGVALGLLTPAVPFQRPRAVSDEAHRVADLTEDEPDPPDADAHHWLGLTTLSREAVSPLARVEHLLHPWTSFLVIPLFALANAGVRLSGDVLADAATSPVTLGIVAGLVLGKLAGVTLASLAAVRLGIGRLPEGMQTRHVVGVGAVAGIGFTVSIFIAELAFADGRVVDLAKIGVLVASALAGALGAVAFSRTPRGRTVAPSEARARE
jgi:NhaA family Na+:H+ antiporter